MAHIHIETETLFDLGMELGLAAAALLDGFAAGTKEYALYGHAAADHTNETPEPDEPVPDVKTDISDCRACWCDRCARIEVCRLHREGTMPDGTQPFPCTGCRNGMRFKPEQEPPCEAFIESGTRNNG